jgi:putative ABC transport system permease protein
MRGIGLIDTLFQDLRYASRMLRKNPGFTLIAVITLALGIGANTAIFSFLEGIILRPLPYRQPEQIVILRQQLTRAGIEQMDFSVSEINDYRRQNSALSAVVEYHTDQSVLQDHATAERVQTGVVSADFFDFFGVSPILGRSFLASDERPGAPPVLLLSYEYWRRNQNGDPGIVGKTFRMGDRVHTVIGVLPPVPQYPDENDVYLTTTSSPFRMWPERISNRNRRFARVFARLKPGVTLQQANSDLEVIASRMRRQYPASYLPEWGYRTVAFPLTEELTGKARSTLWVLVGAAVFVLLIACANVVNFTLARLSQREHELTLRTALGASGRRLFRQLFTESLLLGLLAAGLGLLFAIGARQLLVEFIARLTPRAREIGVNGSVLLFALSLAVLTSAIAGSAQAFSSRRQLGSGLKVGARQSTAGAGQKRVRNTLIVAQVAFSLTLLVGAGLLLRSFINLQRVNPGFTPERVLTLHLDFSASRYPLPADQRTAGHEIVNKVGSLPGVLSAAVSSSFPLDPDAIAFGLKGAWNRFQIEGQPVQAGEALPWAPIRLVYGDYFKTLGVPLIQGRTFLPTDKEGAPAVVIINQAFARRRLAGEVPIGKRISGDRGKTWGAIVGVVGDTKEISLDQNLSDEIYYPMDQLPSAPSGEWVRSLVVRTEVDPMALANQVRKIIYETAPETAVSYLMTLEQARRDTLTSPRVMTSLLGLFAGLALIVAASGIGGMLALSVNLRVKEIGIRLALGAEPADILKMVLKQGMTLVAVGLSCGLVVVLAMIGPLKAFLFQVAPADPFTLAGGCALLAITAFVACYIPARRATKIDPLVALRHD